MSLNLLSHLPWPERTFPWEGESSQEGPSLEAAVTRRSLGHWPLFAGQVQENRTWDALLGLAAAGESAFSQ